MYIYALIMLIAGICVPILAVLNAGLGKELGSAPAACVILSLVALVTSAVILLATGPQAILNTFSSSKHLFFGGVLFIVYILSITFIAPKFGLGNAIFFILLGQILSASIIDHFGLFGAISQSLSYQRITGIFIMVLGIWLTQNNSA
ncbi:MAG: DMT family transporter [Pseudomonadota bacterium]|jgi:transporter family-2 protein|nr:DMT family transporter [Pseudomonadota bacterium]|tara:strand:+ start:503 stop:943 length:441 start_codon:yes stop_codon:yes gene_type:complete